VLGGLEPGAAPPAARWPRCPGFQAPSLGAQAVVGMVVRDGPIALMGCLAGYGRCHRESFLLGLHDMHLG
jgi:hypothetical protein